MHSDLKKGTTYLNIVLLNNMNKIIHEIKALIVMLLLNVYKLCPIRRKRRRPVRDDM